MPIDATCHGCQAKLRMGDEFAGQQARCPRCDAIYTVPLPSPVEVGAEPESAVAASTESVAPAVAAQPVPVAEPQQHDLFGAVVAEPVEAAAELPPADGTQWYLRTPEGPIYGPTSEENFQRWVVEGRVTPDCFVSPGHNEWRPATELFPQLAAPRSALQLRPETLEAYRKQPHRGALILLLGIMGIITTCAIPSIMAWVMGSHDLGEMRMGRMDDAGQSMTNTGRTLGLVFSMIYVAACVIGMFVLVLMAARG